MTDLWFILQIAGFKNLSKRFLSFPLLALINEKIWGNQIAWIIDGDENNATRIYLLPDTVYRFSDFSIIFILHSAAYRRKYVTLDLEDSDREIVSFYF